MVYSDPTKGKGVMRRPVSAISWCTDGGSKIAIAYCSPEFLGTLDSTPTQGTNVCIKWKVSLIGRLAGYTFNIEDPTKHCDTLMTSSPLTSLAYSPKEPQVLAGGCYSGQVYYKNVKDSFWRIYTHGQVSWWDVRTGPQPVASVSFENSHTEPVYKTIWTASKSGSEIMTGGADGLVSWWDIRNFEKAKEEFVVDVDNKDPKLSGF